VAAAPTRGRATEVEPVASERASADAASLYERHSDRIFGFCLYQLGSRSEAEDALQTTFLYALRALQKGVTPDVEAAWLLTIAHNVCRTTWRSRSNRSRRETPRDLDAMNDFLPAPERDGDTLMGLEAALADIPESQRQVILLREWQGLSYREIAEQLGITQTAVEMLIFRARRSLADRLDGKRGPALKRRLRQLPDLGGILTALKSFLGAGSAAKLAATSAALVVATVGVAATAGDTDARTEPAAARVTHIAPIRALPAEHAAPTVRAAARAGTRHLGPNRIASARPLRRSHAHAASAADATAAGTAAQAGGLKSAPGSGGEPAASAPASAAPAASAPASGSSGGSTPPPSSPSLPVVSAPSLPSVPAVPSAPIAPPQLPAVSAPALPAPTVPTVTAPSTQSVTASVTSTVATVLP
jgi:RNA polymerase sigma-70 factor (ECF subfamily)